MLLSVSLQLLHVQIGQLEGYCDAWTFFVWEKTNLSHLRSILLPSAMTSNAYAEDGLDDLTVQPIER